MTWSSAVRAPWSEPTALRLEGNADSPGSGRCAQDLIRANPPDPRRSTFDLGAEWSPGPRARESIAVGADHLAVGPRAEGPVGRHVDRVLDELDAAVGEREVGAAGVVALGVDRTATRWAPSPWLPSLQTLQG